MWSRFEVLFGVNITLIVSQIETSSEAGWVSPTIVSVVTKWFSCLSCQNCNHVLGTRHWNEIRIIFRVGKKGHLTILLIIWSAVFACSSKRIKVLSRIIDVLRSYDCMIRGWCFASVFLFFVMYHAIVRGWCFAFFFWFVVMYDCTRLMLFCFCFRFRFYLFCQCDCRWRKRCKRNLTPRNRGGRRLSTTSSSPSTER